MGRQHPRRGKRDLAITRRWSARAGRLLLATCVSLACLPASAEARDRLALLIANDLGRDPSRRLAYAESDAAHLRDVLVELGDFSHGDVQLVLGKSDAAVRDAIAQFSSRIASRPGPVTALVYYSGHATPAGLELGGTTLDFDVLRQWARKGPGATRLLIVDACHSGSALRGKGGHLERAFAVESAFQGTASGHAILTSSSDDQQSQESTALRASVFTHHFTSGLRGLADTSKDGKVTLSEAWDYSSRRTTAASLLTSGGPQHPSFEIQLTGEHEPVLTTTLAASARLLVDLGEERRVFVVALGTTGRQLALEGRVGPGRPLACALRPGRYEVLAADEWGDWHSVTVELGRGAQRVVTRSELEERTLYRTVEKGGLFASGSATVALGASVRRMPIDGPEAAYGGTLITAFEPWPRVQPSLWLSGATAPDSGASTGFFSLSAGLGIERILPVGDVLLRVGGLVAYEHLFQDAVSGTLRHTPSFSYHATVGLDLPVGPLELRLDAGTGAHLLEVRNEGLVHRLGVFGLLSVAVRFQY